MADHNDPNAVNHIFSDIDYSPADLYDLFGWPTANGANIVFALTFASAPAAGVMDGDLLYRITGGRNKPILAIGTPKSISPNCWRPKEGSKKPKLCFKKSLHAFLSWSCNRRLANSICLPAGPRRRNLGSTVPWPPD